jgi:hypothetical protein
MKKCVVIVAAYRAQSWILNCVKSIRAQKPLDGWQYDIRIGVDGCKNTELVLQRAGISYYRSRVNVGTYIMANSLIALGPADIYSRFDADDYMLPNYLRTVIPVALQYGIACAGHRFGHKYSKPRVGQVTFTEATLAALGGFHAYRCHCDRDFARRAALAGLDIQGMRHDPRLQTALFVRGIDGRSLTHNPKLGHKSKYRREVKRRLQALRNAGQIRVEPQTTEIIKWQP